MEPDYTPGPSSEPDVYQQVDALLAQHGRDRAKALEAQMTDLYATRKRRQESVWMAQHDIASLDREIKRVSALIDELNRRFG